MINGIGQPNAIKPYFPPQGQVTGTSYLFGPGSTHERQVNTIVTRHRASQARHQVHIRQQARVLFNSMLNEMNVWLNDKGTIRVPNFYVLDVNGRPTETFWGVIEHIQTNKQTIKSDNNLREKTARLLDGFARKLHLKVNGPNPAQKAAEIAELAIYFRSPL